MTCISRRGFICKDLIADFADPHVISACDISFGTFRSQCICNCISNELSSGHVSRSCIDLLDRIHEHYAGGSEKSGQSHGNDQFYKSRCCFRSSSCNPFNHINTCYVPGTKTTYVLPSTVYSYDLIVPVPTVYVAFCSTVMLPELTVGVSDTSFF